ncbi:MAG: P-loop NTPase [bacterium]
MNPLKNKRILICGKGGCGKSSVTSLLGKALQKNDYRVILLDADASNPGGLFHLLTNDIKAPQPLIEFFGGRELVTCPSDNPSPLTRKNSSVPVEESAIKLSEIPAQYSLKKDKIILFQIGKIKQACEGCDGPMSKVARDFIVKGGYVTLIDMEAGIEHFGRGVEINVDIILVIVDPVFESMIIAELVARISEMMSNKKVFAILNKIQSKRIEELMKKDLKERNVNYIGTINYDAEIQDAGFEGRMIKKSKAEKQAVSIIKKLEMSLKTNNVK